jgi:hypothetical protein
MEKEGMLKYVENTQRVGGVWQKIKNQDDERLLQENTYIENRLIHETELVIMYGRINSYQLE